jgi:hypothetical protein
MYICIYAPTGFYLWFRNVALLVPVVIISVVDMDPELDPDPVGSETFVGSGVRFRINHFGYGSGQPLSGMNL